MTKHKDFFSKRKVFVIISILLILAAAAFNIFFGLNTDSKAFDSSVIKYTYSGNVKLSEFKDTVIENTNTTPMFTSGKSAESDKATITIQIPGKNALSEEKQNNLTNKLLEKYKDNNIELLSVNNVTSTEDTNFFIKSIVTLAIAIVIAIIYIGVRYKKIGQTAATITALISLLLNTVLVYVTYVLLSIPINSLTVMTAFIIVVYTTANIIYVYDKFNKANKKADRKTDLKEVYNVSTTKTVKPIMVSTLLTALTFVALFIFAFIFNVPVLRNLGLALTISLILSSFSTLYIGGTTFVSWINKKQ